MEKKKYQKPSMKVHPLHQTRQMLQITSEVGSIPYIQDVGVEEKKMA